MAYGLVHLGAALRVFGPLAGAEAEAPALAASAVLWSGAFALFFAAYFPVLTRPRIDEARASKRLSPTIGALMGRPEKSYWQSPGPGPTSDLDIEIGP